MTSLYEATRQQILPNFVTTMVQALEEELSQIPTQECSSFLKARSRKGVVKRSDLIAFLWAEEWDISHAARRIVSYWEERLRLFGPKFAYLPLTPTGAMRCDYRALDCRYLISVAKEVDPEQRTILMINGREYQRKISLVDSGSSVRSLWFVLHILLANENAQRNGFGVILDGSEMIDTDAFSSLKQLIFKLSKTLPIKIGILFACRPSLPIIRKALSIVDHSILRTKSKPNIKVVEGSKQYVVQELRHRGIIWKVQDQQWSRNKSNKPLKISSISTLGKLCNFSSW